MAAVRSKVFDQRAFGQFQFQQCGFQPDSARASRTSVDEARLGQLARRHVHRHADLAPEFVDQAARLRQASRSTQRPIGLIRPVSSAIR
jgi:hypothetical protein